MSSNMSVGCDEIDTRSACVKTLRLFTAEYNIKTKEVREIWSDTYCSLCQLTEYPTRFCQLSNLHAFVLNEIGS